jgi:hypothetical protein
MDKPEKRGKSEDRFSNRNMEKLNPEILLCKYVYDILNLKKQHHSLRCRSLGKLSQYYKLRQKYFGVMIY